MTILTARLEVANTYTPQAPLRFPLTVIEGPVLFDLSILALGTPAFEKIGARVLDNQTPIYPALGFTDSQASLTGSAAFGPILPYASGYCIYNINEVLSGVPHTLAFEFYNLDAAAVIVSIIARVGAMDENIVKVKNVLDIAAEVARILRKLEETDSN